MIMNRLFGETAFFFFVFIHNGGNETISLIFHLVGQWEIFGRIRRTVRACREKDVWLITDHRRLSIECYKGRITSNGSHFENCDMCLGMLLHIHFFEMTNLRWPCSQNIILMAYPDCVPNSLLVSSNAPSHHLLVY